MSVVSINASPKFLEDRLDGPASPGVQQEGALAGPARIETRNMGVKRLGHLGGIELTLKHAVNLRRRTLAIDGKRVLAG